MSLSILNNVAALYAQNNINSTQTSLQKTLQQLSSGSRINSGADDPSGLAVSDGLNANEAALTQSATNATEGIGMLQTADGALSQVTSLLDQAISIATEIGGGTLTGDATHGQIGSANQEYSNILSQITDIGTSTNYNSTQVFTDNAVTIGVSDGTSSGTSSYADIVGALTTSNIGSAQATGTTSAVSSNTPGAGAALTFTVGAASSTVGGELTITGGAATYDLHVTPGTTMAQLAGILTNDSAFTTTSGLSVTGVTSTSISITPNVGTETLANSNSAGFIQTPTGATIGAGTNLATSYSTITTANAKNAAQQITNAIASVAYQRGTIGADINQLSSAASVASAEQVNLSSAQNSISATDYGQAASNLSKYQILSQTGISALAQANSVQQEVLKLLQ
jgi:flagellin